MKREVYDHKSKYILWKEKVGKIIPEISEVNSKIILDYLFDMENGLNVSTGNKKGARSYNRLNNLKQRMIFLSKKFKEFYGVDDITKIETDEGYEKVKEVEIVQITGVISEEEAKKIDEAHVIHAGDFSGKEIKRGETIWLSCLMKKPGLSYSANQQGVLKCRVSDIYLGLSKLNQLMK